MRGMDDRIEARARVPRWVLPAVLLVALAIIWHSLGDHPLYRPDEGRYGAVSAWMAEHGNWLQPRMRDVVHVTKPPLTYWAQAAAITALGRTELAVRLPSAVGASVCIERPALPMGLKASANMPITDSARLAGLSNPDSANSVACRPMPGMTCSPSGIGMVT